jgi:hypothetical protein
VIAAPRAHRPSVAPAALAAALACLGGAAGCSINEPIYIAAPMDLTGGGLDDTGAPIRVKGAIVLRFRQPSADEQKQLDDQSNQLGFGVPWLQRDHIHLELTYTLTNTGTMKDQNGNPVSSLFKIGVDGANEYTKYDEDAVAAAFNTAGEQPIYTPLIQPTPVLLAPGQTIQGTVREDDFREAELDLDAIGRWMAPYAAVLINRSEVNPIGLEMVPPNVVIPAMQEIDLTISSDTTMDCKYMVRVRDDNDQLLHDSGDQLFVPTPTVFMPTIMRMQ